MLGIYDKGKKDSIFIQNVKQYAKQETKTCSELQNLQDCEIAIVHIFDEEWGSLIKDYSGPSRVRIRVSTAGFSDKPPPTIRANNAYTFHLVPSTDRLGEAEWQEILCGLSDKETVKSLVCGDNPGGLRRFFVHKVQEYLPALTILCEGYLAAHAEDKAYHAAISHALDLMEWTKFRESDRGRELIRGDLCDKQDVVRQPSWWLTMIQDTTKRESFYNDVQKEWEAVVGGEVPDALNRLLETILSAKTVEPPKIVADAYCILGKEMRTPLSDWQTRRNKFNHDWLKNKFLNSFDDFTVQLKKSDPDLVRVSEFLEKDFPAWESRRQDAQWIVQSFEDSMSPRQLLESSPLNRCDDETRAWLGHLVYGLRLSRYPVKNKVQESREALRAVNKLYEKLTYELEQSRPIKLTKLTSLRPQFCELKEAYEALSKTLSDLPRYESHGE